MAQIKTGFMMKDREKENKVNLSENDSEDLAHDELQESHFKEDTFGAKSVAPSESEEQELVSKTQRKNEAKAWQEFGKELVELPAAKLKLLPLSDTTMRAIEEFHKQSGNIAKKRHLSYIGKCLRNDDAEEARKILRSDNFSQLRKKSTEEKPGFIVNLVTELLEHGDAKIQQLVATNPQIDRQNIRQLIRNINNAKSDSKKNAAIAKLQSYLKAFQIIE